MILHVDTGRAVRLQCTDALERGFDLLHFTGDPLLSINLAYATDHRLHLTPHGAAQMSHALDHFARHRELPVRPATHDDWSI